MRRMKVRISREDLGTRSWRMALYLVLMASRKYRQHRMRRETYAQDNYHLYEADGC